MRENSGNKKSSNPILKDAERARGVSGNAIQGEKNAEGSDRKRTDARISTLRS